MRGLAGIVIAVGIKLMSCSNPHLVIDVNDPLTLKTKSGDNVPCNTGAYEINGTTYAVGCARNPIDLDDEKELAELFAEKALLKSTGELGIRPIGYCYDQEATCAVYKNKR